MSERGSFVTEYIYCKACYSAAASVLIGREKYLCSGPVRGYALTDGKPLPIIAGKLGGLYAGEELDAFATAYAPKLAELVCHPLRVAVLAECGERIFTIAPVGGRYPRG